MLKRCRWASVATADFFPAGSTNQFYSSTHASKRKKFFSISWRFQSIWQKIENCGPLPMRNYRSLIAWGGKIDFFIFGVCTLMPVEPHFGTRLKKMYLGCCLFTENASESFTLFTSGLFTRTALTLSVPFSVWTTTTWSVTWSVCDLLLDLNSCLWNLWVDPLNFNWTSIFLSLFIAMQFHRAIMNTEIERDPCRGWSC